jgi:uncharacterized protein with GYD domain
MPKFLIKASYTAQGAQGLLKEGGTKRREAAAAAIRSVGGTLESFYYALGDADAIAIFDAPDLPSVLAASVRINASGAVTISTTQLLSAEDMDAACRTTVIYRAPGA